jgi:hypothetical protein
MWRRVLPEPWENQLAIDLELPAGSYLAASNALAGKQSEAEAAVAKIRQFSPNYQLRDGFLTQFKFPEDRERFIGGLQTAGLSQHAASRLVSFQTLGKEVDKKAHPGWQMMPVRVNEPGSRIIDLELLQYRH